MLTSFATPADLPTLTAAFNNRYAGRFRPARLTISGPSYFKTNINVTTTDHRIDKRVEAILGLTALCVVNRSVNGAPINLENPGGYATFLQQNPKTARTGPYVSSGGAHLIGVWSLNDLGKLVPSGDTGAGMAQIRAAIISAYRTVISRARASAVIEAESGSGAIVTSGFATGTSSTFNSGTGTIFSTTVGDTATFTIPADFPGGAISIGLVGAAGAFGGTITWTGTASQGTGGNTTSTSNILPAGGGVHGHLCYRITGLAASDAGKTITATVTALDAGGRVDIDYYEIESINPPMVIVCNSPRIRDNAAYASFGNYWGNTATPGSTGDADVQASNADLRALVAEFDAAVQYVDIDAAMGKSTVNLGADGIHPNEVGAEACAQAIVAAIDTASLTVPGAAHTDYPLVDPVRVPRNAGMDYGPLSYGSWTTITLSSAGLMYLVPFLVTEGGERFSQFGIEITTPGVASSVQLGVYNDFLRNGGLQLESDVTGGPLATTAAANTAGLLTAMNLPVDPGQYYLALHIYAVGTTNAILRAINGPVLGMPIQRGTFAATPNAGYSIVPGAGVALPKRVNLAGAGIGLQSPVPMMALRR